MTPSQAAGGAPTEVEIAGLGFGARVETDFSTGQGTVDSTFQAVLAPAGGGAPVPLERVQFTERRTLLAVVPARLAHGLHDLVVTDPAGRSGFLERAFRVVTPASAAVAFRVDPVPAQRAGASFSICVSAIDAQGHVVDGFDGTVTLVDATGTITPGELGPFTLGQVRSAVTVHAANAADSLAVADSLGRAGASDAFPVEAGLPVAIAFTAASSSFSAQSCAGPFALELRDKLDLATPAESDLAVALDVAPEGGAQFFADPDCSVLVTGGLAVAMGEMSTRFWLRATRAGQLTLRVRPDGIPSASQSEAVTP
jgi:hypothetical protein